MARNAKAIPEGYTTVTPFLIVKDVAKAIEFYERALGAEELHRMGGPGEKVRHAEIRIGSSRVMLGAEGGPANAKSPLALGGTAGSLYLYVENADASFARAVKSGAKTLMPVADMFWGDRYGKILDPFGHEWGLATHQQDLSPEQIGEQATKYFATLASLH